MTRCLFVLGAPRSGITTVAGILHTLGVDMTGAYPLQPKLPLYPKGFWEDSNFTAVNDWAIAGRGREFAWLEPRIEMDEGTHYALRHFLKIRQDDARGLEELGEGLGLWGIKDPRLCFTAQFIEPLLESQLRCIVVNRGIDLCTQSVREYAGHLGKEITEAEAEWCISQYITARDEWLAEIPAERLTMDFADILEDVGVSVNEIAEFAYDGLGECQKESIVMAQAVFAHGIEEWGL